MELGEKLGEMIPQLTVLENEYQHKYNDLLLTSQRASQPLREAEASEILRTEEIYEKYQSLKVEVRVLLMRKDIYFEISRNLRSYNMNV
jgi:hypothetical protein